jgi:hypothetical protein
MVPSDENSKFDLMVKRRLLEREERIQEMLKKEDTIRHLERCSMQYLYEKFFPDAPLLSVEDVTPVAEITSNDIGQQEDETVFFSTADTHFSFLTRWHRRGFGTFLTSTDRHNNVLEDAISVNSFDYFFRMPLVFSFSDVVREIDFEERGGMIFFHRHAIHYDLSLLYRTLEGTLTFLPPAGPDMTTVVLHVGVVPWKLVTLRHEEGFTGVMFENLHAPEEKYRYILCERKRFFPCMLEGVHYYIVASEEEHHSDLVRFSDNRVVKSFFTGGNPSQVICCTGYLVVVSNSLDDGLVNVFTLYLAP